MKKVYASIAESKIRESIKKGELKGLPGEGEKVDVKDLSFVPEEDRMANTILASFGMVPNEMALKKEIETLEEKLAKSGKEERVDLKSKLDELSLQYNIMMEKRK